MTQLPEPWKSVYEERQHAIRTRLAEFAAIEPMQYFYELAYCILTPQSSAKNADQTIAELMDAQFLELGFDPTSYLRDSRHYIRFHNVKSRRLLDIRENFAELLPILLSSATPFDKRESLLERVKGIGMKEASHFLRNIGMSASAAGSATVPEHTIAILDRHIFRHLARTGVIAEIPRNAPTRKEYLRIERAWNDFAHSLAISLDELDLLFWSMETGEIRK